MCFPSKAPTQLGKFHLYANLASILCLSSAVGDFNSVGASSSQMASQVFFMISWTVELPSLNLVAKPFMESPEAK